MFRWLRVRGDLAADLDDLAADRDEWSPPTPSSLMTNGTTGYAGATRSRLATFLSEKRSEKLLTGELEDPSTGAH